MDMKEEYLLNVKSVLEKVKASEKGLSSKEASFRLNKYGKNELPKKKESTFFDVFISQFKSPIVYILLIAMILSFIVNEITDGVFIFIVILGDAILGSVQEYRSNKNAKALNDLIKVEANVIRDGKLNTIPSKDLVMGDIVVLESGDRVPADLRLIETKNLSIDESVLTGESVPSEKYSKQIRKVTILNDRFNMAYTSTSVMRGRGKGVVVKTGSDTEIGKIASIVMDKETTLTPLQIRMNKFTKQLGNLTAILALITVFILYSKGYAAKEIFFLVVALSVSAIPEGLPMVITMSLSISSSKMAKKNVLVKKLNAIEALGSSTVIASDKTGTLTMNQQTVKKIVLPGAEEYKVSGIGYNDKGKITGNDLNKIDRLIKEGVYNNEASLVKVNKEWVTLGDTMDSALLVLGYKYKLNVESYKENVIGRIPYESDECYSAAFYKDGSKTYVCVKGSLEKVLSFCKSNTPKVKIRKQNEKLAEEGFRVLAFASASVNNFKDKEKLSGKDIPKLNFLGLVAFVDPVRSDAKAAVGKCKNAGISVVMVTGDHPLTAFSIGKELGLCSTKEEVTTGEEIERVLSDKSLSFDNFIKNKKIFSRVSPKEKQEIVAAFKRNGEFIAVSGDGVNDALALKEANVSIAMGSGTDTAREVSSLIITDDKFSSIVNGVEEGRIAYDNVRKVVHMLLSCGVCEVIFYLLSIILNYSNPLTAIQLLWLNLVTDGIQDVALTFEKADEGVMGRAPRKPEEGLFDKLLIKEIVINGVFMGLLVFLLWIYLIDFKRFDIVVARSYVLLFMVFIQNIHVFNSRSEKTSIFKKPIKDNYQLVIGIGIVLLLQFIVSESELLSNFLGMHGIPFIDVTKLFIFALPIIFVSECIKYFESFRNVS